MTRALILAISLSLALGAAVALSLFQRAAADETANREMAHHHAAGVVPGQTGQAAFAAIQEIVGILEADPKTDWARVDIEVLRQHLIDMNNVTLDAVVTGEQVPGGMRYVVSSAGAVRDSIRRMVAAHAAAMNGVDGWRFESSVVEDGATLTVLPPAKDLVKLRGLGFIGVMVRGMHHPQHHLMLARGENPHE
jgi:hypothetical protein